MSTNASLKKWLDSVWENRYRYIMLVVRTFKTTVRRFQRRTVLWLLIMCSNPPTRPMRSRSHSGKIPFFVDLGNIVDQTLRVRLFWMQDYFIGRSTFNKFSMLHNIYAVRNIVCQANIMGDENNRHAN